MVSADLIRTVVGIIGNGIALGLFLSPIPTFWRICKKRSVEQFSPTPYLATLLNCMMWCVYGLPVVHPHSVLVITINGSGVVIEGVFLFIFLLFSDRKKRLKVIVAVLVEIAFVVGVAAFALTVFHTYARRSLVIGSLCIVFCAMMYAAPLSIMKMVITTKSVEYMPLTLSLASLANGVCWTTYALIRFDLFITIPNSVGALFAIAQLILYAAFYRSTQRMLAERKGKEMALSEVVVVGDRKKIGSELQNGHGSEIRET